MSVIRSLQNLFASIQVVQTERPRLSQKPAAAPAIDLTAKRDLQQARSRLIDLYRSLETLAGLTNVTTRFKLDLPDARSSESLGLNLTETAAALLSTEEINASPMSFSPFGPDWLNGSSAELTIGGEYDGTHGSGNLSFEVSRPGIHGVNNLRIGVRDPSNNVIGNYNIQGNDPPDQQYDLQNGLYFTLGPNVLLANDTTSIQVFDNIGAAVDPDMPLAGIRNNNPNFQFGTPSIVDGSFQLNGENIIVGAADTLNDVVNRINASNAGVTTSFNAITERIEFLQDTLGSAPTIDLQSDTSNFLEATKLTSAIVAPGTDREDTQVFEDVAEFASVQSGNILINGSQIAIDIAADSLSTVIDKINGSSADVVASFDSNTQLVVIEANNPASVLEIDSNGTGFFPALKMVDGRVDPEAVSGGFSRTRSYRIADAAAAAFAEISDLFRDASFLGRGANSAQFRDPLESAIQTFYGDKISGDLFGLRFDDSGNARQRGDFASIDRRKLTKSLQLRGGDVKNILASRNDRIGLIDSLLVGAQEALVSINKSLGISGTFIDTLA